jgi:hypothetical protein
MSDASEKENVRPLSARSAAILDASKALIDDSVSVVREYCKTMISVSLTSLGIFLAVVSTITKQPLTLYKPVAATCSLLFLSAVLFIVSLFPKSISFNPTFINDSENALRTLIVRRKRWAIIATCVYLIGIGIGVVTILVMRP